MARTRLWALAGACHPGPVAAVTAATALYATSLRRSLSETLEVTAAVLAGQLAIGWQNDALDAERDEASGRRDKPAARGAVDARALRRAAAGAGLACVPLSLGLGPAAGRAHLAAVAAGSAYNLGLRATPASPLPYLVAFGLLPSVVHRAGGDRRPPPWWLTATAALLGAGAHVANVLPDLDTDVAQGIRGLPHRLGRAGALGAMAACLLGATGLLASFGPGSPALRRAAGGLSGAVALGALALAVRVTTGGAGRSRAAFRLVCAGAVADVGWLLAAGRLGASAAGSPGSAAGVRAGIGTNRRRPLA